jgi:hypothetical protein
MCATTLGLLIEMGGVVSLTFCPGWPQTLILLIFTSQVAGITGRCSYIRLLHFLHYLGQKATLLLWPIRIPKPHLREADLKLEFLPNYFRLKLIYATSYLSSL